jgi:type VI secretion system protein ImpL
MMSNNSSFLLGLICVASENTAAAELEELKAPFQPVQHVTPPGCTDQYVTQNNQQYMNGLIGLQTSLESVRGTDPNDPAVSMTLQSASQAKMAARQLAQAFRIDKEGQVERMTQKLLEDPITYVEGLLGRLAPAQVNAGAGQMCADFAPLMRKYPFDPNSQVDATIADINAVFQPGAGSFWSFYDSTLKQHLLKQGARYVPNPSSSGIRITPQFLGFFNRAAAFSDALYNNGTQQEPSFVYTLRTLPMEVIASLTLTIGTDQLKSTGKGGTQATFNWPGRGQQQARLSATPGGRETDWLQFSGLWASFRLFEDADRWQRAGNGFTFEVTQRSGQSGQPVTVDGKPVTVRFALEMGTSEPIFQKGYLSGLRCVSQAAQ